MDRAVGFFPRSDFVLKLFPGHPSNLPPQKELKEEEEKTRATCPQAAAKILFLLSSHPLPSCLSSNVFSPSKSLSFKQPS